jgi:hypothetical protein
VIECKDSRGVVAVSELSQSITAPIAFYVNYGPASVKGDRLVLTEIPNYARGPIEVEVIAYQWGRMANKLWTGIQSAEPISREFQIEINPHL